MKKQKKIVVGVLVVVILIFGILYWLGIVGFFATNLKGYLQRRSDQQYLQKQESKINNLIQAYKEDKYGGDTPQETWKLFIDALKKGDVDLASKYFVVEKQKSWKFSLDKIVEKGLLKEMEKDLLNNYKSIGYTKIHSFIYEKRKDNTIVSDVVLILNKQTNKWKILDL